MSEDAKKPTTWTASLSLGSLSALLLFGLYFGAYWYAQEDVHFVGVPIDPLPNYPLASPLSSTAQRCIELFFMPAHEVDRILRPKYWNTFRDE